MAAAAAAGCWFFFKESIFERTRLVNIQCKPNRRGVCMDSLNMRWWWRKWYYIDIYMRAFMYVCACACVCLYALYLQHQLQYNGCKHVERQTWYYTQSLYDNAFSVCILFNFFSSFIHTHTHSLSPPVPYVHLPLPPVVSLSISD